jgi:hypothetical protein
MTHQRPVDRRPARQLSCEAAAPPQPAPAPTGSATAPPPDAPAASPRSAPPPRQASDAGTTKAYQSQYSPSRQPVTQGRRQTIKTSLGGCRSEYAHEHRSQGRRPVLTAPPDLSSDMVADSNHPRRCSSRVQQPHRPRSAFVRPRVNRSPAPATCTDPYASRW